MKLHYLVLLIPFVLSCSEDKESPPNIIFILIDDLGWADVQANFPESFYETPHINQLAREGVLFTQAYAAHPVCSPTRAAIITGKHPNRVGITDWLPGDDPKDRPLLGPQDRDELSLSETTLAEKLKENGYRTGFVGKWHLGHDEAYWPEHQGFDVNIGGWEAGQPRIVSGVSNGYFSPYGNPRLEDGPEGEYLTDRLTAESLQFIRDNRDNPFFLYLAYYTVHTPIQAAKDHIEKFEAKRASLGLEGVPHEPEGEGYTKLLQENAAYASMVAAMDENVGRILETLKKEGLDKNTWVVFTSDNGGLSTLLRENAPTANGPLRAGKGWCYEGGIRVPLIISGPEVTTPGRREDVPVVSMDFFTTLLSLAKIEHDVEDGENLLPILRQEGPVDRDLLFWHYPHYHGSAWKPGSAVRKGDWKLIYFYEEDKSALYNLLNDLGERRDLAEKFPEKVSELKHLLDSLLSATNAKIPVNNSAFK
ncbi:sulfatase [Lunatibacter salilacus]|uniref:sulfatase n=1 Tax=Lunatibacter salilacus TaxID=2483804 RepID=UPI00131EB5B8|nr:sulfatase [Lunatibacter salilacus]